MKTLDKSYILGVGPYFSVDAIDPTWSGSVIDLLALRGLFTLQQMLWLVLRNDLLTPKLMRSFAIWCAQQVEDYANDARSLSAVSAAQGYLNGNVSTAQLYQVWTQSLIANMATSQMATAEGGTNQALNAAWDASRCCCWAANADETGVAFSNCARSALNCARRMGGIVGFDEDAVYNKLMQMIQAGTLTNDVL